MARASLGASEAGQLIGLPLSVLTLSMLRLVEVKRFRSGSRYPGSQGPLS
ncbi:MAG: hypothetical protein ABIM74_10345 [candidate division WOR-3 bacterium]